MITEVATAALYPVGRNARQAGILLGSLMHVIGLIAAVAGGVGMVLGRGAAERDG
jgi:hypothetical protein